MDHVHFDREAIRKSMIDAGTASFEDAMQKAPDDDSRAFVQAQYRLNAISAEVLAQIVDMGNAGRSQSFMGQVLGVMVGTLFATVVRNSNDPNALVSGYGAAFDKAIKNVFVGPDPNFTSSGVGIVLGERGGRA